jgi:hypothetical protein
VRRGTSTSHHSRPGACRRLIRRVYVVSKFTQGGEKLDDVIKWAENDLEGTLRA